MPEVATPKKSSGWTTVAFGDVVQLSKERSSDPEGDGYERYIGLEHIDPGELHVRRWGDIADGVTFTNVFKPGQVLFGKRRAYQRKVAVAEFSGVCSGDIYVLEPKGDALLPELLPFVCQTDAFFEHAVGTSAGSLSPRTNWKSLATFEFALPPIEEQRRIVRACRAVEATLDTLFELTEAARVTWLATVQHFEDRYADEATSLGDLLDAIEPGRSVVGSDHPPSNGEYAVLKVSAVDPFGFQPEESKVLLNQDGFMPEHVVRAGDLLITRSNTPALVGETCIVECDYPNLMLCDKTLRLVPKPGVSKNALWHMLQSNRVRQQIAAVATGTGGAMKNISQPKIRALRVRLPPSDKDAELLDARLDDCIRAFRDCRFRRQVCQDVKSAMLTDLIGDVAR
jgi:type I restriction enzyme S subunit